MKNNNLQHMSYTESQFKQKEVQLQTIILNQEKQLREAKREKEFHNNNETLIQSIEKRNKELLDKNEYLEKKIKDMELNHQKELNDLEMKKQTEIFNLSHQIRKINSKFETAQRYETYLQNLEEINYDLNATIAKLQEEKKLEMEKARKNYTLKLNHIKQTTLDVIGSMKKETMQIAQENNSKSVKIQMLQAKELFNEISEQSKNIEELILKLEEKDKIIQQLRLEINIQKKIDKCLVIQKNILKNEMKPANKVSHRANHSAANNYYSLEKEKEQIIHNPKNSLVKTSINLEATGNNSRNRNNSNLDMNSETSLFNINNIKNLKTKITLLKNINQTSSNIKKMGSEEMINEETLGDDSKKQRTFQTVKKEEVVTKDKIKLLNNYDWYLDLILKFLKELKENQLKIQHVFNQENLDSHKINIIVEFVKELHNEIKNRCFEQKIENKTSNVLSKSQEKFYKFRSKSILDDFFSFKPKIYKKVLIH